MLKQAKIKQSDDKAWLYSTEVKKHFFNPQNVLLAGEEEKYQADAIGKVGSPACGDEMLIFLKIDPKTEKILDLKWQTFGCGSAIASTSMLSTMVLEDGGMTITEALKISPKDIVDKLGGLPDRKIHCSVLGDQALLRAINNWFLKTGQIDRIILRGQKIIDEKNKITAEMIEDFALNDINTLSAIKEKLKITELTSETEKKIQEILDKLNQEEKQYYED